MADPASFQIPELLRQIRSGNRRALARAISLVESDHPYAREILVSLKFDLDIPVVGLTGPPGAGKSSLLSSITGLLSAAGKQVGIVAVDPTSPFSHGAVLGDRIRMASHFNDPNVYIRSMATRGALGGLSPRIFEVIDLMRYAGFDYIFVETVGVGQSEVEIAGLADTTILALVPEAGDEVQTIKSGIMEIADIFVVNKGDRDGADTFVKNLYLMVHERSPSGWNIPVIKTVAIRNEGIEQVINAIHAHRETVNVQHKKLQLLTEKAIFLIRQLRMRDLDRSGLQEKLGQAMADPAFNVYAFIEQFA